MTALTAAELRLRLRHRFTGEGYAFFKEVRFDRTDSEYIGGRTRRADGVAVGLQRRTDHTIHGFEIKVNRPDWLQELRDRTKAQDALRFCHYWWLVVSDPAIIRPGELPDGWGLLVPRGRHLRAAVRPTARVPDFDYRFMASLVQAAATQHGYCAGWARMDGYTRGLEKGFRRGQATPLRGIGA